MPRLDLSKTTMMAGLCVTNLLNYVDRGIVPGAADAFDAFITKSHVSGTNAAFGALQSAFIVGFSLGSVAVGYLVHRRSPFGLAACGLFAWCIAAFVAGLSKYAGSYWLLLVARACSGLGEAGFNVVGGPYIQDAAGASQGTWLGAFYAMIPCGTAIGYGYGALVSRALTWSWAFFFEALAMAPLAFMFAVSKDDGSAAFAKLPEDEDESYKEAPSLLQEARTCLRQPAFLATAVGYAGYAGSIIGFSTFAPSIAVGLGLYHSMASASLWFSGTIALSGIIGTPLGGVILDRWRPNKQIAALELSLVFNATGALLIGYAAFATTAPQYLGLLFVGTLPLFAATTPMNVAIFESVPRENRALGQAIGILVMHALGDVPSPIIVGALKDAFAPACTPRGKDDELGDKCSQQRTNLRLIALACIFWLLWSLLAFAVAYCKARAAFRRLANHDEDGDDDDASTRFEQPARDEPRRRTTRSSSPAPVMNVPLLSAAHTPAHDDHSSRAPDDPSETPLV